MKQIYEYLIWTLIFLVGIIGIVGLRFSEKKDVFIFISWFVVSLLGVFILVSFISNLFMISFILALIISFIGVQNAR